MACNLEGSVTTTFNVQLMSIPAEESKLQGHLYPKAHLVFPQVVIQQSDLRFVHNGRHSLDSRCHFRVGNKVKLITWEALVQFKA